MGLFTGGASSKFLFDFKTLHVPANLEISCQLFVGVVVTICVESSKVIPGSNTNLAYPQIHLTGPQDFEFDILIR